ncbi:hypothetical protein BU096_00645 [Staphylococcus xylosus]|uniref:hypothetical protein n=1 Tax=Staphylococcus xylosus TaxID=1288 RepID=UPI000D1F81CF|nr:hypothetical protein [Staphylococcus xylosus]PTI10712.1 hypothetical protein BU096_00645 [Staphylococcus xylosus]
MSEPTKDDLLEFMKKHGPDSVDSITDKDSAIKHFRTSSKLYKQQRDQYKAERDTLIDDIAVLKANISRLERGNGRLIKKNNKVIATGLELTKYRSNYINLTNHIRMKAEANPSVDRYIELNNYITRLEKGE